MLQVFTFVVDDPDRNGSLVIRSFDNPAARLRHIIEWAVNRLADSEDTKALLRVFLGKMDAMDICASVEDHFERTGKYIRCQMHDEVLEGEDA